jgi:uncharacterized protein YbjT (DUF2867 family)
MSRRPRPESVKTEVEWAQADIASGNGIAEAVERISIIVHAASDARRAETVDVGGTRNLVEAARKAGVSHLIYISIVGVDDIPFGYYERKRVAEEIIESSDLPYSILRATQFHSLVNSLLLAASRLPIIMPIPTDFRFQSVDESEVAKRLAGCITDGPRGRVADFGGPEVLSLGEMAQSWLEVAHVRKRLIRLPLPGAVAAAFRDGKNTVPDGARGEIRWRDWLIGRRQSGPGKRQP